MRMIMHVKFPIEPFNTLTKEGSIGEKIKAILDAIKPEAAYFTEHEGHRGATCIVNLNNASDVATLAEPWFLVLNATVEFRIAMVAEDLEKANLPALGEKWGYLETA